MGDTYGDRAIRLGFYPFVGLGVLQIGGKVFHNVTPLHDILIL
jgi:hypothetical protein